MLAVTRMTMNWNISLKCHLTRHQELCCHLGMMSIISIISHFLQTLSYDVNNHLYNWVKLYLSNNAHSSRWHKIDCSLIFQCHGQCWQCVRNVSECLEMFPYHYHQACPNKYLLSDNINNKIILVSISSLQVQRIESVN